MARIGRAFRYLADNVMQRGYSPEPMYKLTRAMAPLLKTDLGDDLERAMDSLKSRIFEEQSFDLNCECKNLAQVFALELPSIMLI